MAYPTQTELQFPLLQLLIELGGEARPKDVYEPLAGKFPNMTGEERHATLQDGVSKWEKDVQYTKEKLKHRGEIDASSYGVWRVTEKGRARVALAAADGSSGARDKRPVYRAAT